MCGRFALYSPAAEIRRAFGVSPGELQPRYNIAPSQPLLTAKLDERGGREIAHLDWGFLPAWAATRQGSHRPVINARAESAADKPCFRAAWRQRRCVIPDIHGRMPVVLEPGHWPVWLGEVPGELGTLEAKLEGSLGREFIARRVSQRVNNPRHDGPELVEGA